MDGNRLPWGRDLASSDEKPDDLDTGQGRPGARRKPKITINDIARMAGVSKKTVSRVINDATTVKASTRDKIKALIKEYDFSPDPQARALAFRRSFLVAMIYDNPSPQYIVNMQRGILDALAGSSCQLVIRPCDRNAPDFYDMIGEFIEQQRLFGAVLPPSVSEDDHIAEMLKEADCPYVRIASVELDEPHRMIRTREAHGAAEAARHLARLGHRRIAHIRGPESFRSSHERLRGFQDGLSEFGLHLKDDDIVFGGYTYETGYECARQLLAKPERPTAIFAGNDEMALGVYKAARELGLSVPADISVVGFDDTPIASRIAPYLTTVHSPIRDIGYLAGKLLMDGPKGPKGAMTSITPELVVRESTAAPAF